MKDLKYSVLRLQYYVDWLKSLDKDDRKIDRRINVLQIDGAVIAGALVFLTISNIAIVILSSLLKVASNIPLIYKAVTWLFALAIVLPFSLSAILILVESDEWGGRCMIIGFCVIPSTIVTVSILYLLAGFGFLSSIKSPG